MVGESMLNVLLPYRVFAIYFPFVALRMKSAISVGCETYDAWLALSDRVVAFICSANVCWMSGGII